MLKQAEQIAGAINSDIQFTNYMLNEVQFKCLFCQYNIYILKIKLINTTKAQV